MRRACQILQRYVLTALITGIFAPSPAGAENWPCFRGATRQGISNEKNLPVEWSDANNIVWKTPIPGRGWSSPIVWGDRIYLTTATEEGTCLRLVRIARQAGTIVWDREILKQKAGHKHANNSYATSTPVTDGENVYVLAADGSIAAVSNEGDVVWTNREFKYYSEHGLGVSPVLYKELVIIPFDWSSKEEREVGWQKPWDKAFIWALDKNTGQVKWKAGRGQSRIAHVTPNILSEGGTEQLISPAGDVIQGFDLTTGERIWTAKTFGEGVVPSVVIGDGLIYQTSGFPKKILHTVHTGGKGDVTETHMAWETDKDVSTIPSMLYVKPYLYTLTEGGVVRCLKADTGEQLWKKRLPGRYSASPVFADGKIYFLSEQGRATVIEAGPEFKRIAQNDLKEKCVASIAISQGNIFIRTEKNLFCIGITQINTACSDSGFPLSRE